MGRQGALPGWCPALVLLAAAGLAAAQQPAASGPTYYIAADVVQWNYAPSGVNLCTGEEFVGDPSLWTKLGVGSVYSKAQYRQYTDATFQTLVPKPASEVHTGVLGPVLRASVGHVLTVVLKNNLGFPVNLEPAGVQPEVAAGGDAAAALARAVAPGANATYRWLVPASMGPQDMEPTAKLWLYRSTVDLVADANAGLVGPLLVSNTPEVNTGDVAAGQPLDIITVLQVLDENASPFLEANLANRTAAQMGVTEAGLAEGNLMHAINGYVFCNTPGMEMTQGQQVRWHMGSVGTEVDMHNLHLHGNTFLNRAWLGPTPGRLRGQPGMCRAPLPSWFPTPPPSLPLPPWAGANGHRANHLPMIPGTARTWHFPTDNAGFGPMTCHWGDPFKAGMKAMYQVNPGNGMETLGGVRPSGTVRTYYVEAEEVEWDYAPRGGDYCTGSLLPWTEEQEVFTEANHLSPGSKLMKAQYIEYTDDTFTTKKPVSASDAYLGLLGPIIRAEVGDTIQVVFKNSLRFPATMHPHGVAYLKNSEGSPYFDGTMGADRDDDHVQPGTTYTYTWQVAETSGPGPADLSNIVWMYHSHTNEVEDVYAGLVGALVIGRKGSLKADLTAQDVDKKVVLLFMVSNEVHSLYADVNAQEMGFTSIEAWESVAEAAYNAQAATDQQLALQEEQLQQQAAGTAAAAAAANQTAAAGRRLARLRRRLLEEEEEEEGYEEPMLKHGINGYLYCNMPQLTFTQGEKVRFHILALGTEVDMHTPNFVGQSLQVDNQRSSAIGLMPGAMHSVDIVMANPGISTVQCRVADHISAGMQAVVKVLASEEVAEAQDTTAAATTVRRYFIAAEEVEWDYVPLGIDGCTNSAFGPDAEVFVARTAGSIGSNFTKAQYKQYTDATFTTPVEQPAWQGILGPTLVTEVGQALEIVFQNRLDLPANLMLDGGLELLPAGADGKDVSLVAPVAPGGNATYRYYVPESAGPASEDLSTVAYVYTSSVDLVAHPNAGLVGVLVVGSPGTFTGADSKAGDLPQGVDAMVPLLFTILNEAVSPYLQQNLEAAGLGVAATYEPVWGESNLKHAINGYLYCNLPGLEAVRGSTLRLLLVGMGSEADMHSPVFTGQVLRSKSAAYQTAELMPTVTRVVDVEAQQAGTWPVYCVVHDHFSAGMRANLVVQ
ncbi:hypothetical protein CHLNCDRAFT_58397 [Chlorella variabilis]|uniref:Plastocyanin-like domain-containing protein n=1 Tax=Chlorella variabilis TaxID=554065 RepID=E1ZJX5_CHLVA|nr:hypothetical protein CHLNCDRAFT_58397 [Chlorella variabilis]EFN54070.1 hypothetical protein CHLNCDRAFT_58397 [Chlorella variabilis]|eukprot:XP_005846172.1 hypothetical protein CHLNCDRAFT_58397 [Chlorella variabilis]